MDYRKLGQMREEFTPAQIRQVVLRLGLDLPEKLLPLCT